MKLHVKKGDNVTILTGKDKGKSGRIVVVNPDTGRIIVDNANIVFKHSKPKSAQKLGSIEKRPGSIDSSNVQILCPACNKPTRVAKTAVEAKGKTKFVRTCKKCSASLDVKQDKKPDKKAKKAKKDDKPADEAAVAAEKPASKTPRKKAEKTAEDTGSKDGITEKNADGAIV